MGVTRLRARQAGDRRRRGPRGGRRPGGGLLGRPARRRRGRGVRRVLPPLRRAADRPRHRAPAAADRRLAGHGPDPHRPAGRARRRPTTSASPTAWRPRAARWTRPWSSPPSSRPSRSSACATTASRPSANGRWTGTRPPPPRSRSAWRSCAPAPARKAPPASPPARGAEAALPAKRKGDRRRERAWWEGKPRARRWPLTSPPRALRYARRAVPLSRVAGEEDCAIRPRLIMPQPKHTGIRKIARENAMAWDFETDPEFQKKLDWIEDFMAEEVEPLSHLGMAVHGPIGREKFIKPLQQKVKRPGPVGLPPGPRTGRPGLWPAEARPDEREAGPQRPGPHRLRLPGAGQRQRRDHRPLRHRRAEGDATSGRC